MITTIAYIENITSRKDKTWKVTIGTNELSPEKIALLSSMLNSYGYMAFKEDEFKTDEIEALESLESGYEDKGKTPGKRLRDVLYVLFKQSPEGYDSFGKFYDFKMEQLIEYFKNKLD